MADSNRIVLTSKIDSGRSHVSSQHNLTLSSFPEDNPNSNPNSNSNLNPNPNPNPNVNPSPNSNSNSNSNVSTKREICWPMVLFYIHLHSFGLYGLYLTLFYANWATVIFTFLLIFLATIGATIGCHRLWAHGTFKATFWLRMFLMVCQTLVGQSSIYSWVRWHRLHHRYFRQNDDPFFSNRNFLHAQVHAQMLDYSPQQKELLNSIDMSDLEQDGVVMFQKRFYWLMFLVLHVLLPINTPLADWNESLCISIFVPFSLRYMIVLNMSWLINSAHFIWGLTKTFRPSDSNSVFFVSKSYWPHYHYLLPNDYQSGEFGEYSVDLMTKFIRVFVALEWASDLSTVSPDAVRKGLADALRTQKCIVDCIKDNVAIEKENASIHY